MDSLFDFAARSRSMVHSFLTLPRVLQPPSVDPRFSNCLPRSVSSSPGSLPLLRSFRWRSQPFYVFCFPFPVIAPILPFDILRPLLRIRMSSPGEFFSPASPLSFSSFRVEGLHFLFSLWDSSFRDDFLLPEVSVFLNSFFFRQLPSCRARRF